MNKAIFFSTEEQFREWLMENNKKEKELIVGFFKVKSKYKSMTWSQSVDQALCFGWIDGMRKSIDKYSYQIRFTPRKKNSIWSPTNIQKMEKLIQKGLVYQAGIEIFKNRTVNKSYDYAFKKNLVLPKMFINELRKNKKAWDYFESLAPSYKKHSIHWVISAVKHETKIKRFKKLMVLSEQGVNKWRDNKYKKNNR